PPRRSCLRPTFGPGAPSRSPAAGRDRPGAHLRPEPSPATRGTPGRSRDWAAPGAARPSPRRRPRYPGRATRPAAASPAPLEEQHGARADQRHRAAILGQAAEPPLALEQEGDRAARTVAHVHPRPREPAQELEAPRARPCELMTELQVRREIERG